MNVENAIKAFVSEIKRGPFKHLRDYEGTTASEYIAKQNKDIGDTFSERRANLFIVHCMLA